MLPFTSEQFLAVFRSYNTIGSDHRRRARNHVAWTGIAYHLAFFATINKAAYVFGAPFIIQAIGLAYAGFLQHRIAFGFHPAPTAWLGAFFVLYATILYPLIGMVAGHSYPELPIFGVTPCPVTIFTFGVLLLTLRPPPMSLLAIPALWSLIGGSAAIFLSVSQDWLLLVSGMASVGFIIARAREIAA